MAPLLRDDADLLRNDAPHVGHAYTTVQADALARWHRLVGDDVFFLTGTDEHGAKVARGRGRAGREPQEWADRTSRAGSRRPGRGLDISNDDFIRTTEPRHHRAVQRFLQLIYDNGYIELGTYRGLYCVACEDYYTEDQLVDGTVPDPRPAGRVPQRRRTTSSSSRAFEDRLLEWYERHPRGGAAGEPSATRRSSFIKERPATTSRSPAPR